VAQISVHSPILENGKGAEKPAGSTVRTLLVTSTRAGPFYKPGAGILIQRLSHHPPAGWPSVQMSTTTPRLPSKAQHRSRTISPKGKFQTQEKSTQR